MGASYNLEFLRNNERKKIYLSLITVKKFRLAGFHIPNVLISCVPF